ncbi:MAG: glycosyltransferase family 4 protein [Syntrophobacterales bacterium]|nr:glycosyltransferase family 4 protein [Syntrophobacterales bacterium]
MRILLVTPFFPPEVGSASHLYFELGQELRRRGHEVFVLTGLPRYHVVGSKEKYRRRLLAKEDYQGLQVMRVFNLDIPWNSPLLRGIDQWVTALNTGLAGVSLPDFDAALVYSPPLPLALAALGLCRLRGRPLVVNIQDLFPQSAIDLGILTDPHLIAIFRRLESLLYRRADFVMVHSEGNKRHILKAGGRPERVVVIPNWVDTQSIKPGPKNNGFRAALRLHQRFIVTFAGVMGYSQDLDTVLASADVLRGQEKIAFVLVGDGVEKERLVRMAHQRNLHNVYFMPMQPKDKYPEVLAASDLCLVTLRKEVKTPVVPSKILSIMAAGRPVLASLPLEGDAPQLIATAQCGVCLPPGEPYLLAQEILRLSQDPHLCHEMGVNGRRYAVANLSLENCVTRLEALFQQLCQP